MIQLSGWEAGGVVPAKLLEAASGLKTGAMNVDTTWVEKGKGWKLLADCVNINIHLRDPQG